MYICLYPEILYIIYDNFLLIVIVSVSYLCVFCISVFASPSCDSSMPCLNFTWIYLYIPT
ncbi:hypothetical protein GY484_003993 [Escherichia coli]|nr:hypothetical protein [Escherichia coli]